MREPERHSLLFELGTEELPPKTLTLLARALGQGLREALSKEGLCDPDSNLAVFASPRRLGLRISGVASRQPGQVVERRGPPLSAALDAEGRPTPALVGFARSCGVAPERLQQKETPKGTWLVHSERVRGLRAPEILQNALTSTLQGLPIAKRMRWGAGSAEFVRPALWCVLLLGSRVLPVTVLGLKAGRYTRGHRFLAPGRIRIDHADEYEHRLEQAFVLADQGVRSATIRDLSTALAAERGMQARISDGQLEEVTGLVEWPEPLLGHFDPAFLALPPEVLVSAMQRHQKYFPVENGEGGLMPYFVAVTNLISRNPESVRRGNERVLSARFADAQFFWDQDRQHSLASRIEGLREVAFQDRLGSLRDKAERMQRLAASIAEHIGQPSEAARRAAWLGKTDLRTGLVGEFPELQGTMGRYYAQADGEDDAVATAIESHYAPRSAQDAPPTDLTGAVVGLADRLDTLCGMFGLDQGPTGDKDPFGLRRAALGVLRILMESPLAASGQRLPLPLLLEEACDPYGPCLLTPDTAERVYAFVLERARHYLLGRHPADEVDAVLASRPACLQDLEPRLDAVHAFRLSPDAASVIAANKRIRNLLKQAAPDTAALAPSLPDPPAEQALRDTYARCHATVMPLLAEGRHAEALGQLTVLGAPLARFFDEVLVLCEEPRERAHRLRLLAELRALFLATADLSQLKD